MIVSATKAAAYIGERTPCYLRRMTIEQAIDEEDASYD